MDFSHKHAIVTGGANGIGLSVAEKFLEAGAAVTTIDKDKAAGERLRQRHKYLAFYHGDIAEKSVLEDFAMSV